MNRAVPVSVVVHLAMLLLVVFFGAWVDRPVLTPRKTISVELVQLPEMPVQDTTPEDDTPPPVDEAPVEEPAPVVVEPEPVVAEPEPDPVPEKPVDKPVVEPEPEPVVEKPEPVVEQKPVETIQQPADTPAETSDAAAEAVPDISSVSSTDREVPPQFQYYLTILQGKISRQWQPKRVGMRESSSRYCIIHFFVERDGRITRETIARSSGVSLFDKEAIGAVRRAGRMPPLPAGISGPALGVNFSFTLKSGT